MKIALAQINQTVGDIKGNTARIVRYIKQAQRKKADVIAFPELAVTGYPPEDLLFKPEFINANLKALDQIRAATGRITAIVGFVDKVNGCLYNAAAVIHNRRIVAKYHKVHLPNYGVFDEKRYFRAGNKPAPVRRAGRNSFRLNICEDIWVEHTRYKNTKLLVNISASPFHAGKHLERCELLGRRATDNNIFVAYVNLVGGQDELVFDGRSMVVAPDGSIVAQAKAFAEDLLIVDISFTAEAQRTQRWDEDNRLSEIYGALKLGLKDYVRKNGFRKVVLGLSGGIDSALTAVIAADALGKANVIGVFMPSRYTSSLSSQCVRQLAKNLGIKCLNFPIQGLYNAYLKNLKLSPLKYGLAAENLQSRIRGTILMALSNQHGWLVLTTGNKSELSTGYATLYGDMAGGLAVLKDVPKTLVYDLTNYRNEICEVIPLEIIDRPPTAELKPNQKDSDTLPPYEVLDPILKEYVEEDRPLDDIIKSGSAAEAVHRVVRMVDRAEYKRRQSPPGIKITHRAFGRDRRFPITNKF